MNVRALAATRLLMVGAVAAVMVGMAYFGDLWRPLAVAGGLLVGAGAGVVAERSPESVAVLDDVPPALFALVGVALAWGGAAYAPALAISAFAGVAVGYVLAAAAVLVVDG